MRAMSAKRRKSTARMRATRHIVNDASQGICGRCGRGLAVADDGSYIFDDHHVIQRGVSGDDDPTRRVALHHACHMWVHDNIDEARTLGLIVDSWEAANV